MMVAVSHPDLPFPCMCTTYSYTTVEILNASGLAAAATCQLTAANSMPALSYAINAGAAV